MTVLKDDLEFDELVTRIRIENGKIITDDLNVNSSDFKLKGGGYTTIEQKVNYDVNLLADKKYNNNDLFASPSSGSFKSDGMIISPCSIKTLSSIANGYCNNLISRSALCCLKEGRKLVLVLRETQLDLISIENMKKAKINGAIILPAMPAFYHSPNNIDDLVNYIVGKILDQFNIEHNLFKRWK